LRWHASLVRRHWAYPRPVDGRPRIARAIRALVLGMVRDNPGWGYRRIHGELVGLGYKFAPSTVWQILKGAGIDSAPTRSGQSLLQRRQFRVAAGHRCLPWRDGPRSCLPTPAHLRAQRALQRSFHAGFARVLDGTPAAGVRAQSAGAVRGSADRARAEACRLLVRRCQAAHGGLKAPIWVMIVATSSAAHSSLILPSVTR